jgi:MFS family permease
MHSRESKPDKAEKAGFIPLVKRLWPTFTIYNSLAFTISTIFINVIIVSNIIWPGEVFHATEFGFLSGVWTFAMAFSGIFFGLMADRFSRVTIMGISEIIFGMSWLGNAFVPEGLGLITYFWFFLFIIVRGFASGGFFPTINSHVNDSIEEKERSQFFGILQALFQFFQILGMLISAIMLQNQFWTQFFSISGIAFIIFGLIILFKANEAKRGSAQKELKDILQGTDIKYEYKLNKDTFKTTILSTTNIIAFIEGIFTTVLLSVPDFLLVPYIESDPHNFSPFITSLFMIIFSLPGGLIGSIALAKLSDRLALKNIKNRIYMIIFSIVTLFFLFIAIFNVNLPHLTPEQGNDFILLVTFPVFWLIGLISFFARFVIGLWNINQPPILQAINLPEAQGLISSANQFLENIGSGLGYSMAGFLLVFFNYNYQITVILTMSIGITGAFLWFLATFRINNDVNTISTILKKRGVELTQKNHNNEGN